MLVISIGVANVVLHVPNDGIVPVGDVQCAIFTDDRIGGTEIAVGTVEEFYSPVYPKLHQVSDSCFHRRFRLP